MTRLSARERRLVAVLLLVAAIALAWFGLVAPVADGFAGRAERRAALRDTYARDERTIGQIPAMSRQADLQRRDRARYLLVAPTPAAAAAVLKERLGGTVAAAGGEVRTVEDVAAPAGRLRARLDARLTLPQLTAVLQRLETAPPLLLVDAMTVATDPGRQAAGPAPMDVRLEIDAATPAPR